MMIYGPNGSGKSNLIKAMDVAKKLILNVPIAQKSKYAHVDENGKASSEASYFEFVYSVNETVYSYGFEFLFSKKQSKGGLVSEWLYELNPQNDVCLFEIEYEGRSNSDVASEIEIDMVRSSNEQFSIHNMGQISNDEILDASRSFLKWIKNELLIEGSRLDPEIIPVESDFHLTLGRILSELDTGIVDIELIPFRRTEIPINLTRRILNKDSIIKEDCCLIVIPGNGVNRDWLILSKHTKGSKSGPEFYEVEFIHESGHMSTISYESLGTMRIVRMLAIMSVPHGNRTAVVDEIECSVHTLAVRKLMNVLFRADFLQVVATTHRVDILRDPHLSTAEVSFAEIEYAGDDRFTHLFTMRSFGEDVKDKYRYYMDGRFGALPIFISHDGGE